MILLPSVKSIFHLKTNFRGGNFSGERSREHRSCDCDEWKLLRNTRQPYRTTEKKCPQFAEINTIPLNGPNQIIIPFVLIGETFLSVSIALPQLRPPELSIYQWHQNFHLIETPSDALMELSVEWVVKSVGLELFAARNCLSPSCALSVVQFVVIKWIWAVSGAILST